MAEPTQSTVHTSAFQGFLRRWLPTLICVVLAAVTAGTTSYVVSQRMLKSDTAVAERYDEPLWLRDLIVREHMFNFRSVYKCSDGSSRPEIPCPDYIATVDLQGPSKDTPPVIVPARNAKGEVVIDFKTKWEAATCFGASTGERICLPDRWDVEIIFAESIRPFATNAFDPGLGEWQGFKLYGPAAWGDNKLISPASNDRFEVYAGDHDTDVLSPRLPADRIGNR